MNGRPRIATVLTSREWEVNLVEAARATSAVRVVRRAYEASEIGDTVDVVVAGAETAWVGPAQIRSWRRMGIRVLGLHPPGDRPARLLLERGAADEIRPDVTAPMELLHLARVLAMTPPRHTGTGRLVVVTGASGAPGRTEVAVALAFLASGRGPTVLVDLDDDDPSVSLRLGLPPRPCLLEAVDGIRLSGRLDPEVLQRAGPLDVLTGAFGAGRGAVSRPLEVALAATESHRWVIVDSGRWRSERRLTSIADQAVLVCDASPTGLVRGAGLVGVWDGPEPDLVVNRADGDREDVVRAARRSIGLDPAAVVRSDDRVRSASVTAREPAAPMLDPLGSLLDQAR